MLKKKIFYPLGAFLSLFISSSFYPTTIEARGLGNYCCLDSNNNCPSFVLVEQTCTSGQNAYPLNSPQCCQHCSSTLKEGFPRWYYYVCSKYEQ